VTIGHAVKYAATHHAGLAIQAGIPKEAVDEIGRLTAEVCAWAARHNDGVIG
jgi:hypothetical protein